MSICLVEACEKPTLAKKLCRRHYRDQAAGRELRPYRDQKHYKTLEERFWAKVAKADDCWDWTGTKIYSGYGKFWTDGVQLLAHRVSYELANGPIPDGLTLDHTCHNRSCVNPDHLRLATQKQNLENRSGSTGKSGHRGVTLNRHGSWDVCVTHHGEAHRIRGIADLEEAAQVARDLRNKYFTHNDADRA